MYILELVQLLFFVQFWILDAAVREYFNYSTGNLDLYCPSEKWMIAGTSCFKSIETELFTFGDANKVCTYESHYSSEIFKVDDWFVYYELSKKFSAKEYWTSWYLMTNSSEKFPLSIESWNSTARTSIYNPIWSVLEPQLHGNLTFGQKCVSWNSDFHSHSSYGWRIRNCTDRLPVICETFPCFKDFNGSQQYRCSDNSACISHKALCDDVRDCNNNEDEQEPNCKLWCNSRKPVKVRSRYGHIYSPDYKSSMLNINDLCVLRWVIVQNPGVRIKLNFLFVNISNTDELSVHNEDSGEHFVIDSIRQFITSGSRIVIAYKITQDKNIDSIRSRGFNLFFTTDETFNCNRVFESWNGTFSPPKRINNIEKYVNATICKWKIHNREREIISVKFRYFELSAGDVLKIYDGTINNSSNLFGNFSRINSPPAVFLSDSSEITFIFQSHLKSIGAKGFEVTFERYCENQLLASSWGTIESLNFRFKERSIAAQRCSWIINMPCAVGKTCPFTIFLDFLNLINTDELTIVSNDKLMRISADSGMPQLVFRSNSSQATIILRSSSSVFRMRASYSIDCPEPLSFVVKEQPMIDLSYRSALVATCNKTKLSTTNTMLIKCVEGGKWVPEKNTCEVALIVDMCVVPEIRNGYIRKLDRKNNRLYYACNYSYLPRDNQTEAICANGEKWLPEPFCVEISCTDPLAALPLPIKWKNDIERYQSAILDRVTFGNKLHSKLIYKCPNGTIAYGRQFYAECLPNKTWSYPEMACQSLVCQAEPVKFGAYERLHTKLGEFGRIKCRAGFVFNRKEKLCISKMDADDREYATWNDEEASLACINNFCKELNPCGEHGKCESFLDSYTCVCDEYYQFNRTATTGRQCEKIEMCKNDLNLCTDAEKCINDEAGNFTCSCGNEMVLYDGNFGDKRVISNKKFLFKDRTCIRTRCYSPTSLLPVNSEYFIESDSQLFLTKATVNIYCQGEIEPLSLRCQENGRWDRTDRLICSKTYCGQLFPPSPTRIVNWKASYDVNDMVNFSCGSSKRYLMLGPSSSICLPNGTWSGKPPHCVLLQCSELFLTGFIVFYQRPTDVALNEQFPEGTEAILQCRLENGTIVENGKLKCIANNDKLIWNGEYRSCSELNKKSVCEVNVGNDLVVSSKHLRTNDVATFQCVQPNYVLSNVNPVKCKSADDDKRIGSSPEFQMARVRRNNALNGVSEQQLCIKNKHGLSTVYTGETVNMYCHILSGCEHYKVRWVKASSGGEIASTHSFELHNLLVIGYVESAQISDQGEYLCEVINGSGDVLDFASWVLKVSTARLLKSWREILASTPPTIARKFDSAKNLKGWNASNHWTQFPDGSWKFSPMPFSKDFLITPMVEVKSDWLGISVDLTECNKCLVWLSYYSTNLTLDTISIEKFSTLGGATLDPNSHSILFVLPFPKVWILVTVDSSSTMAPLKLSNLRVTVTACPKIQLGQAIYPETIVSPNNKTLFGICAFGNSHQRANLTGLVCGPQGKWSLSEEGNVFRENDGALYFSNCFCNEGYVEQFGACVQRGPLCYTCVSSNKSNCTLNRDVHFCEADEVCRSRIQFLSFETEIGFVEKTCTPAASCTTVFQDNLERCMSGMEECTFCCSHDGCNWRPERAVLRRKSVTTATTTITSTTTLLKTRAIIALLTSPTTAQLTTLSPVDSMTLSVASFHTSMNLFGDKINSALNGTPPTCLDRQPMRIVCKPTLQILLITAPTFYEPTIVPFPAVEDNDPSFTLNASIPYISSRFPHAFNGSEREIVWKGVDRHGISTTCTTKLVYSTIPLNAAIEKPMITPLSDGISLSCPEERYVDEHWSVDSMTTTTFMRFPSLQFIEGNDYFIKLNRLIVEPPNGSFVEFEHPVLVNVTAFGTKIPRTATKTFQPVVGQSIVATCQFWYEAVDRNCPLWAVDSHEFMCSRSANMTVCYRKRPCHVSQREFPENFRALLCAPGPDGWRLVSGSENAIRMADTMPLTQMPVCLEEISSTVTLSISFDLVNIPSVIGLSICKTQLSAGMQFELENFLQQRCPVVNFRFSTSKNTPTSLNFNFTTSHADADQVLVCIRHVTSTLSQDLSNFMMDCRSNIRMPTIRYHLQCSAGWGANLNARCEKCPTGHFVENGVCTLCPFGTYAIESGTVKCIRCPPGTSTLTLGNISPRKCIPRCPSGTFSATGLIPCKKCPIGTFQFNVGEKSCMPCHFNMTTLGMGTKSAWGCISLCSPGTFLFEVANANSQPRPLRRCRACPKGYYQTKFNSQTCERCPYGTTTIVDSGAASSDFCRPIANCNSLGCNSVGECIQGRCRCKSGFFGIDCSFAINLCNAAYCLNSGNCSFDASTGSRCQCPTGSSGKRCEIIDENVFECSGKTESMSALCRLRKLAPPINNTIMKIGGAGSMKATGNCLFDYINGCPGGKCVDGRCECADDFTFLNGSCMPNVACKWSPCGAFAGNCSTTVNRDDTVNFHCSCPADRFGRFCEILLCQNGGIFFPNVHTNGQCVCPFGWRGRLCERPLEARQLDSCLKRPCGEHGTCHQLKNSSDFYCECDEGFIGEFCSKSVSMCSAEASRIFGISVPKKCLNGGSCLTKSIGDGKRISTCSCLVDFTGEQCETFVRTKCSANDGSGPCLNGGECFEGLKHDIVCHCGSGFTGKFCEAPLKLDSLCPDGYAGCSCADNEVPIQSGLLNTTFECAKEICGGSEAGQCLIIVIASANQHNRTVCACKHGYYGEQCEHVVDYCQLKELCLNGGTCINQLDVTSNTSGYHCKCTPKFAGKNCEHNKNACSPSTCKNGGNCMVNKREVVDYACECPTGFDPSDNCASRLDLCARNPGYCRVGRCVMDSVTGEVHCQCPSGYVGLQCETKISDKTFNLFFAGIRKNLPKPSRRQIISKEVILLGDELSDGFTICAWIKHEMSLAPFIAFLAKNDKDRRFFELFQVGAFGIAIGKNQSVFHEMRPHIWNQICVMSQVVDNANNIEISAFVNGIQLTSNLRTELSSDYLHGYIQLYDSSEERYSSFNGEISLVEMYSGILSTIEMNEMLQNCVHVPFIKHKLIIWSSDYNFSANDLPSVDNWTPIMLIFPGICTTTRCLPGRYCPSTVDKIPPIVQNCPKSQHLFTSDDHRSIVVEWDDREMFRDDSSEAAHVWRGNYRSGQLFTWGKYRILYMAMDDNGNAATCEFDVVVAPQRCTLPTRTSDDICLREVVMVDDKDAQRFGIGDVWSVGWTKHDSHKSSLDNGVIDLLSHKRSSLLPIEKIAELTCSSPSYLFTNAKPLFYTCDVMGLWDRFSGVGASFNPPACAPTTTVLQQLRGSVLFEDGECLRAGNYLAAVSDCVVRASVEFGGFCKMFNCDGQLILRSTCERKNDTTRSNAPETENNQNDIIRKRRSPSLSSVSQSKVLISYELYVNNTKHAVEPTIRDAMRTTFGDTAFTSGRAHLSCTNVNYPLLHITIVNITTTSTIMPTNSMLAPATVDDIKQQLAEMNRPTTHLFETNRTSFAFREEYLTSSSGINDTKNRSTTRHRIEQILQCGTCASGETWLSWLSVNATGTSTVSVDTKVVVLSVGGMTSPVQASGECAKCPPDTYKPEPGIHGCIRCPPGETTGGAVGCQRKIDCFLNCSAGTVYDHGLNECVPCPKGQYMPHNGRFKCLPCPIGVTTLMTGSTSFEQCSVLCGPGEELSVGEECVKCGQGTYRSATTLSQIDRTSAMCVLCPIGFNTSTVGAESVEQCTWIYCIPGTYRNPAVTDDVTNATFVSVCLNCPHSTYQDEYNATSCKSCPLGQVTTHRGATTVEQCEPPPPPNRLCAPEQPAACPPSMECVLVVMTDGGLGVSNYQCRELYLIYGSAVEERQTPLLTDLFTQPQLWPAVGLAMALMLLTCALLCSIFMCRQKWIMLYYRYCPSSLICCKKMTVNDISGNDYMRDITDVPVTRETVTSVLVEPIEDDDDEDVKNYAMNNDCDYTSGVKDPKELETVERSEKYNVDDQMVIDGNDDCRSAPPPICRRWTDRSAGDGSVVSVSLKSHNTTVDDCRSSLGKRSGKTSHGRYSAKINSVRSRILVDDDDGESSDTDRVDATPPLSISSINVEEEAGGLWLRRSRRRRGHCGSRHRHWSASNSTDGSSVAAAVPSKQNAAGSGRLYKSESENNSIVEDPISEIRSGLMECLGRSIEAEETAAEAMVERGSSSLDELEYREPIRLPLESPIERNYSIDDRKMPSAAVTATGLNNPSTSGGFWKRSAAAAAASKLSPTRLTVQTTLSAAASTHRSSDVQALFTATTTTTKSNALCKTSTYSRAVDGVGRLPFAVAASDDDSDHRPDSGKHLPLSRFHHFDAPTAIFGIATKVDSRGRQCDAAAMSYVSEGANNIDRQKEPPDAGICVSKVVIFPPPLSISPPSSQSKPPSSGDATSYLGTPSSLLIAPRYRRAAENSATTDDEQRTFMKKQPPNSRSDNSSVGAFAPLCKVSVRNGGGGNGAVTSLGATGKGGLPINNIKVLSSLTHHSSSFSGGGARRSEPPPPSVPPSYDDDDDAFFS